MVVFVGTVEFPEKVEFCPFVSATILADSSPRTGKLRMAFAMEG
jgi:hypothetical protein